MKGINKILIFGFLSVILLLPQFSYASVVFSQPLYDVESENVKQDYYAAGQWLGVTVTATTTIDRLILKLRGDGDVIYGEYFSVIVGCRKSGSSNAFSTDCGSSEGWLDPNDNVYLFLNSNRYSTSTLSSSISSVVFGVDPTQVVSDPAPVFTPNNKYWFMLNFTATPVYISGSTGVVGSLCWRMSDVSCPNGDTLEGNIDNSYFVFYSDNGVSSGQFTNRSPYNGEITLVSDVDFSFDYYFNPMLDNYDKVAIQLNKVSNGGMTISTSSMYHNIISTGGATYTQELSLNDNENYMWRPYLYSSVGSSTPLYGTWYSFWTVSNPTPRTQVPSYGLASSSNPDYQGFSTSTVGSSTVANLNLGSFLPDDISDVMKQKFPFSYLYDVYTLITELANGTSASNASYSLPLGAVYTNPSTQATSSSIVVMDQSAITSTGYVSQIRSLISMAVYFTTALYLVGAIMAVI